MIRSGLVHVSVSRLDAIIRLRLEGVSISRPNTILDRGDIDMIRSGSSGVSSLKIGYYE